jgi:nucleotide-binding universal stress UspA family protein
MVPAGAGGGTAVTPASRTAAVRSILVPVDGSPSSRRAVELAAKISSSFGASLTLLHVAPMKDFPALMAEAEDPRGTDEAQIVLGEEAKLAESLGTRPSVELRRGRVSDQILRSAAEHRPDLIIMGTRGLTGAKSVLLGSVSRVVSRRAKAQVVLVR